MRIQNRTLLQHFYKLLARSRKAFTITETELKLIANAAIIGDSRMPKAGQSTPA